MYQLFYRAVSHEHSGCINARRCDSQGVIIGVIAVYIFTHASHHLEYLTLLDILCVYLRLLICYVLTYNVVVNVCRWMLLRHITVTRN